jgi:prepilin signal peptidase PulO-like enzyme (type II secretory pathway)
MIEFHTGIQLNKLRGLALFPRFSPCYNTPRKTFLQNQEHILSYVLAALAGLVVGLLVNYFADFLPTKRRLIAPECLACGTKFGLTEYLIWPRRCNTCQWRRSPRTWIIEAIYIGVAVWLWAIPPVRIGFVGGIVLLAYFGLIVIIDIEHRLILNATSLLGAIVGLAAGIWLHGLRDTLLGGVAGFGAMLVLYVLGAILMGWLARRRGQTLEEEALGFGDVNLGGVLGLLLGWPGILLALILTILLAGVVSLVLLLVSLLSHRYRHDMAIPYGPFLVSSAVALLFFRDVVLHYLGW